MKTLKSSLLFMFSFLYFCLLTNEATAQFTCSTAIPFQNYATIIAPTVGTVAQSGPAYGCVAPTLRPMWVVLKACNTGDAMLSVWDGGPILSFNDTLAAIAWGPFSTMNNVCNQLTAPNIVSCQTSTMTSMVDIPLNNVQAGDIYIVMIGVSASLGNPFIEDLDYTIFNQTCSFCNSVVSVLNQDICIVSADTNSSGTKIIWEENSNPGIYSSTIYRESTINGVWDSIATIPRSALSEYVDLAANPAVHPWRYQISANDSCGNTAITGSSYQTIHLQASPSLSNAVNLAWTHFYGFPDSTFYIYRGLTPGTMTIIDSVSNNVKTYTDFNAPAGLVYYQVTVRKPGGCIPTRTSSAVYSESQSNIGVVNVTTDVKTIAEESFSIAPNPFQESTVIKFSHPEYFDRLSIYSMDGRLLRNEKLTSSNTVAFHRESLSKGVYIIELDGIVRVKRRIVIM